VTTKPRDHIVNREESAQNLSYSLSTWGYFGSCCHKMLRAIFGNRYLITPAHMEYVIEEDEDEVMQKPFLISTG
jgi:hypothetical protein